MKKIFLLASLAATVFVFTNCGSSKKAAKADATPVVAKSTFDTNIQTLLTANCSPCHIPAKGGNKRPYDNFANAKADIDEIIRRIELNPGDRGFMPFRGKAKLSDSTINAFKQWKTDGLLQN